MELPLNRRRETGYQNESGMFFGRASHISFKYALLTKREVVNMTAHYYMAKFLFLHFVRLS